MGEVVQFPDTVESRGRYVSATAEPALVIILPVIKRLPPGAPMTLDDVRARVMQSLRDGAPY